MGCTSNNKAEYIARLKSMSEGTLNEKLIEEIIVNTYYTEKELVKLYKKFLELKPNKDMQIESTAFMELPNIKYCAFKKFLVKAFNLEGTEEVSDQNVDFSKLNLLEQENVRKSRKSKINQQVLDFDLPEDQQTNKRSDGDNDNRLLINNFMNRDTDQLIKINNQTDSLSNDRTNNLKDRKRSTTNIKRRTRKLTKPLYNHEGIKFEIGDHLIDFRKFCDFMKIFNIRYPVDLKIKFYYKIFDIDGDGYISKKDMIEFLEEVLPNENYDGKKEKQDKKDEFEDKMEDIELKEINIIKQIENEKLNTKKTKEKKPNEDIIDHQGIVDLIFTEILGNNKRNYLEIDEFQKLMWNTTIDSKCVIYLASSLSR